jgi:hypothetical protein
MKMIKKRERNSRKKYRERKKKMIKIHKILKREKEKQ